jgi:hypothetical protein
MRSQEELVRRSDLSHLQEWHVEQATGRSRNLYSNMSSIQNLGNHNPDKLIDDCTCANWAWGEMGSLRFELLYLHATTIVISG